MSLSNYLENALLNHIRPGGATLTRTDMVQESVTTSLLTVTVRVSQLPRTLLLLTTTRSSLLAQYDPIP